MLLPSHPLALSTLLEPHNSQPSFMTSTIYGLGLETVGMSSQLPYRLVAVFASLACVTLLYVLVRRHTDPWLALVMIVPVLGLGAAWEALLLALSMNFLIGIATGLGMLLALEFRSRRADLLACFLLCCSLTCGGVGLAFLVGACVDVLVRRDFRRVWVPAVPVLLYAAWSFGFGDESSPASIGNALHLPEYLYRSAVAGVQALTGLGSQPLPDGPAHYLTILLILALGAAALWRLLAADRPINGRVLVVGGVLLAFWVLGGLTVGAGRAPEASRYQYPATIFLILFMACLLDGLDLPRWLPTAVLPFALASLCLNIVQLEDGRDFLVEQTEITRAAIGQVEIQGDGPRYYLNEAVTGSPYQRLIASDEYLKAERRFGSPAYSPEQIAASSAKARRAAERVIFADALARQYAGQ